MAKMKNSMRKILLKRKISDLEYKKSLAESYLIIKESVLAERREKKVEAFKNNLDNDLFNFELDALENKDYQKLFTEKEIEKIDNKSYWEKRAIEQKYKRLGKKENNASLEREKAEEISLLEQKTNSKKALLLSKFQRDLSDSQVASNKELYQKQVNEAKLKLAAYEKQLNEIDLEKIKVFKEETKVKTDAIQAELDENYKLFQEFVKSTVDQNVMSNDSILRIEHLTMQFGGLKAVDSLDFEVKKGEIFGLIGPNGAGKTTVFNCITQFYKANHGNIYFKNSVNEIIHLNEIKVHNVIKHGIVRTFQNVELIWELNVLDNMLVGGHSLYKSGFFDHSFHTRRYKHEESILKMRARKILEDLDLLPYQNFYPVGLPYGILKKIELARTLMSNPSLIILDEPAAGLNDSETEALADTIKKIQKDYNCTIFLVEHDMGLVMSICDTICAISFGKKLAIGSPSEIQKDPLVQQAYLGGE